MSGDVLREPGVERCEHGDVCEHACRMWCRAYKPRVDRDALLEQVEELEKCAYYFGLDFDEDEPLRDRLKEASEAFAGSADRIRKALGVES